MRGGVRGAQRAETDDDAHIVPPQSIVFVGITIGTVCSIWFRYGLNVPSHADINGVRGKAAAQAAALAAQDGGGTRHGRAAPRVSGMHFLRTAPLYQVRPRR